MRVRTVLIEGGGLIFLVDLFVSCVVPVEASSGGFEACLAAYSINLRQSIPDGGPAMCLCAARVESSL